MGRPHMTRRMSESKLGGMKSSWYGFKGDGSQLMRPFQH